MIVSSVRIHFSKEEETKNSSVLAHCSAVIDDCILLHSMRIIKDKEGELFVGMPRKRWNNKYVDIFHPTTREFRDQLCKAVLEEYDKQKGK